VSGPSIPITADTRRCHAAAGISITRLAAVDSVTVAAFSQYSTRFDGGHHLRRRNTKRRTIFPANTPMP
jgi:hypothetical protein